MRIENHLSTNPFRCSFLIFSFILLLSIPCIAWAQPLKKGRPVDSSQGGFVLTGKINSSSNIFVRNRTDGELTIVSLVPSGSRVKKGDILVQFDSSALKEKFEQTNIEITQLKARQAEAQGKLDLQRILTKQKIELAETQVKLAVSHYEMELSPGGRMDQEIRNAQSSVKLAESRLKILMTMMNNANKQKAAEVRLLIHEAENEMAVARSRGTFIETKLKPHRTLELESEILKSRIELLAAQQHLEVSLKQAKANLESNLVALRVAENRGRKIAEQLNACSIRSVNNGVFHHLDRSGIEEGSVIRSRQTVGYIPDMKKLQVEALVSAQNLKKIKQGRPVVVMADAFPDRTLRGTIRLIEQYPVRIRSRIPNDARYRVFISLQNPPQDTRLGMTVKVRLGD